jgi:hypothetical protein
MRSALFEHHRRLLASLVFALLLGCGGKSGDGGGSVVTPPPPLTPTFRCTDSPVMTNQVALVCVKLLPADVWQIDVVIGPPTTATNIDGFAFDVLFDPTLLAYVDGSARAGTLFFQGGPTPLVIAQTKPGEPGRLVVGIHPTGTGGGVGATTSSFDQILIFNLKLVAGTTFDPQLLHFDNYEALDPLDQPIPSIRFSDQLLLSNQ